MGISIRDLTDKERFSMREVARDRGFAYLPFSLRELVTPQLQFGHDARPDGDGPAPDTRPGDRDGEPGDTRPGEQGSRLASEQVRWANWIDDYVEDPATRLEPENRTQLRKAMVNMLDVDGPDARVRSVGSGHSHSMAAEPSSSFIDMGRNRGKLSHRGWLRSVGTDEDGKPLVRSHDSRDGIRREDLVRLRSGTVLKRLNREILPNHGPDTDGPAPGKALANMGSWDGQTLAGAINTATHGTGIELGSLADVVQSVEIATVPEARSGVPIVQLYRIEPEDGITDREAFEADAGDHEMQLIQDDDVFYSAVVGYGCMGNVAAYTIEVEDAYWLSEQTELHQWNTLRDRIDTDDPWTPPPFVTSELYGGDEIDEPAATRHFSFLLNLPATQRDETPGDDPQIDRNNPICLAKRRKQVEPRPKPSEWNESWPPERRKHFWRYAFKKAQLPYPVGNNPTKGIAPTHLGQMMRKRVFEFGEYEKYREDTFQDFKATGPFSLGWFDTASYIALRRLPDRGTMTEPDPPKLKAITTEIAIQIDDLPDAIEDIFEVVRDATIQFNGEERNVFFVSPMGIRYVAASEHHLSPEYHGGTDKPPRAMIEVPMPAMEVTRVSRPNLSVGEARDLVAKPALNAVHNLLVSEYRGRPHMGKYFNLDGENLDRLYPRFRGEGGWMETYRRFNAFGTFNNEFTEQLGISQESGDIGDPLLIAPDEAGADGGSGGSGGSSVGGPGFGVLTGVTGVSAGVWLYFRNGDEEDAEDTEEGEP